MSLGQTAALAALRVLQLGLNAATISPHTDEPMSFLLCPVTVVFDCYCLLRYNTALLLQRPSLLWRIGFFKMTSQTVTLHGAGHIETHLSKCHFKYLQNVVFYLEKKIGICDSSDYKSANWFQSGWAEDPILVGGLQTVQIVAAVAVAVIIAAEQ